MAANGIESLSNWDRKHKDDNFDPLKDAVTPIGLRAMSIPTADPLSSVDGLRKLYQLDGSSSGGVNSQAAKAGDSGSSFGVGERTRPRILYSSLTHSQLAKVVAELKHTRYR